MMTSNEKNPKIVIYTCIMNNYDILQPVVKMSNVDFICFTNTDTLKSDGNWKFRSIPDELRDLPDIKKQRIVKICPHRWFPEYDYSLWIDGNIKLNILNDFFRKYDLEKCPFYTCKHPARNDIYDEGLVIIKMKKDTYDSISSQMYEYRKDKYPPHGGLIESNILWRKHNDKNVVDLDEMWAKEVIEKSHRDQMSFNYCAWKLNFKYGLFDQNYRLRNSFFSILNHKNKFDLNKKNQNTKLIIQKTNLIFINEINLNGYSFPTITVMITTHNRTRVACTVIDSLCRNLQYSGNIKWCICDDRSEAGHIEALVSEFKKNNILSVNICKTNNQHWGLGASMNNGLKYAFENGDIVLTTEDDWYLHDPFNIDEMIYLIDKNNDIAGIRIGAILCPECSRNLKPSKFKNYLKLEGKTDKGSVFNNQVMIRHKRIFDKIGFMKENCSTEDQEQDLRIKYNKLTDSGKKFLYVLWPKDFDVETLYGIHNPFYHIGVSTDKITPYKKWNISNEFKQMNNDKLDEEFRKKMLKNQYQDDKVIVSMTSYPKNIKYTAQSIWLLNNKQTRKPDEIHLWLSIEEFPNKEKDLPLDLNKIIFETKNLTLHWLEKNTYVHKRHEIFKIVKSGCVFFIDDDTIYNEKLIETVMEKHKIFPNSIICYTKYNPHEYIGRKILYNNSINSTTPLINKIRWCGQSMIPANIYPQEALSEKNQKIRNSTSPISDECWFQPWIVGNDIPIYYLNFGWGKNIAPDSQKNGIISFSHKKDENGYEKRDNWLYNVLLAYPSFYKKYQDLFNYDK